MPTVPIRDLGAVGLVTDIPAYDLPLNAWDVADNVRFDDKSVSRAPIFRKAQNLTPKPVHMLPKTPDNGFDSVTIMSEDGSVTQYANGNVADVLDTGVTKVAGKSPTTSAFLSQVEYLNKSNMGPLARVPSSNDYVALPNWDSTWKCRSLRSFGDHLIALGVQKGATEYLNMVKWSDLTLAGQVPATWDHTDPANSAGENILSSIKTSLVDGGELGDVFIAYAYDQVWRIEQNGGFSVFDFDRQFGEDAGIMSDNCFTEFSGRHAVFGKSDIYIHDGISKDSIVEGRVRKKVFSELNKSLSENCFVAHNENLNEIYFCYASSLDGTRFTATSGCNRALVYNYVSDTFYFYDLPDVTAFTMINLDTVLTWATVGSISWQDMGGTWADQTDSYRRHPIFTGLQGDLSTHRILALDSSENGEVAFEYDTEAATQPRLERTGIDLDELGFDLEGRKSVQSIFPQMSLVFARDGSVLGIRFGFNEYPASGVQYAQSQAFVAYTDYKVDLRTHGRYLSVALDVDDRSDFNLSGYDLKVRKVSRR